MMEMIIYTDGGARGNPGPAGAGYVFMDDEKIIHEGKKYLGDGITNNWAEYEAVVLALTDAVTQGFEKKEVEIRMDSKLAVEQICGNWKIKEPTLKPQVAKVHALLTKFPAFKFVHVPREENAEADRLVNEAIDEALA